MHAEKSTLTKKTFLLRRSSLTFQAFGTQIKDKKGCKDYVFPYFVNQRRNYFWIIQYLLSAFLPRNCSNFGYLVQFHQLTFQTFVVGLEVSS